MIAAGPPAAGSDGFRQALMESRQRWRDFGAISADLVFEVDEEGKLCFLGPDFVLGWPAESLLGRRAADILLPSPLGEDGPDPFLLSTGLRGRRSWVKRADGQRVCLSLSSTPLLDGRGACIGARGVGADVTAREQRDIQAAAALRRTAILDHILDQMRQEILAPRIMSAMLKALMGALGGEGAAVLDLADPPELASVMHQAGAGLDAILPDLLKLLREYSGAPQAHQLGADMQAITCQASTRFGHEAVLVVWRPTNCRAWDADDRQLIASVTALVRIVLEHEAIQRELARQARTDPLTGLLNRRAFVEEAKRRIDRLEREGLPGTLMFVDLDRLKLLNDRLGHEAGDAALTLASAVLRRIVRPSDLVARLGGDEFALWLDGFDELTAAERAEHLRLSFPHESAHLAEGEEFKLTMSIGIACRQPGGGEELDDVIQRADRAMYDVKRNGRGHWRVSHPEHAR